MRDELKPLLAALDDVGPQLHRLLARITLCEHSAEDLLQQLVLNLVERPDRIASIENLHGYLRRMAIHAAFNWRRDRMPKSTESLPDELPGCSSNAADAVEVRERAEMVLAALDDIPHASREVILLRFLQEESYDDIAAQLGKTQHQVRSLCNKGIQMLRRKLRPRIASILEDDR